jgi:hypothetical protein
LLVFLLVLDESTSSQDSEISLEKQFHMAAAGPTNEISSLSGVISL